MDSQLQAFHQDAVHQQQAASSKQVLSSETGPVRTCKLTHELAECTWGQLCKQVDSPLSPCNAVAKRAEGSESIYEPVPV